MPSVYGDERPNLPAAERNSRTSPVAVVNRRIGWYAVSGSVHRPWERLATRLSSTATTFPTADCKNRLCHQVVHNPPAPARNMMAPQSGKATNISPSTYFMRCPLQD
jgi:hypothetical protein